jgi:hypothetical protein
MTFTDNVVRVHNSMYLSSPSRFVLTQAASCPKTGRLTPTQLETARIYPSWMHNGIRALRLPGHHEEGKANPLIIHAHEHNTTLMPRRPMHVLMRQYSRVEWDTGPQINTPPSYLILIKLPRGSHLPYRNYFLVVGHHCYKSMMIRLMNSTQVGLNNVIVRLLYQRCRG